MQGAGSTPSRQMLKSQTVWKWVSAPKSTF